MNQLPDYRIIQLEVARDNARGEAECKELALINCEALLKDLAPFIPVQLWPEYMRVRADIDFARRIGDAA